MRFGCERLWDEPKAGLARELLEGALGKACPCKTGGRCPILPKAVGRRAVASVMLHAAGTGVLPSRGIAAMVSLMSMAS